VFLPWIAKVEEASGGTLKIRTFTGGTLGRDPAAQLKMVEDGVADIAYPSPPYTPGRFPDSEVAELPGLFKSSVHASTSMWKAYDAGLLRGLEEYKVLGMFSSPPFSVHTSRPVASVADLQGLKLRSAGAYAIKAVEALGATAVGMPITEATEAITRGVIDGMAGHPSIVNQVGAAEVAKNHFQIALGTGHVMLVMKKSAFDALPEAARKAIDDNSGMVLSTAWGEANDGQAAKLLEAWRAPGSGHTVVEPAAADLQALDAKFAPIQEEWKSGSPKGDEILSLVKSNAAN
jgi:TRAP-type C4-dicarboxylate transport system substrate-binding protein